MSAGDGIIEFTHEGGTNSEEKEIVAGTAEKLKQRIGGINVSSQNGDPEGNKNDLKISGNQNNILNLENPQCKSEEMNTGDETKLKTNPESTNSGGTQANSEGNERDTSDKTPSGHDLQQTKQRQQEEWEDFVSGLSEELQEMMGGHYASEDTERYVLKI